MSDPDKATMTTDPDRMEAGLEMDRRVAEALGLPFLGICNCWGPDGCWTPHPEGTMGRQRIVLLDKRMCDCTSELVGPAHWFGHSGHCLEVGEEYSTDPAAALGLLKEMHWWHLCGGGGQFECSIVVTAEDVDVTGHGGSEALAICRAFLKSKAKAKP